MQLLFRNATAFASYSTIVDKTSCAPLDRKSIRVSSGAVLKVPCAQGVNINDILVTLNDADFHLYALSPSAANILKQARTLKRTALIFGTEDDGLPPHVLQKSETLYITYDP